MAAFFHHLAYDFKNGLRDRSQLLMNYLFPLGLLVMFGALMGNVNPSFLDTMIPAMIMIAIMSTTLLGMPTPIVTAREAGVYRSFKINGVPAASIIAIPVISAALHMIVVSALITIVSALVFHAALPVNWGYFLLVTIVVMFSLSGLGTLIGVIAANSRSTVLLSQIFFVPSMILSGMMVPLSMLPEGLLRVGLLLPGTCAMNAWRVLAYDLVPDFNAFWSVMVLLIGGILAFAMSVILFKWDNNNQQRGKSPWLAAIALIPYILAAIFLK
jgi:ABC-2 type transport system permease protein